jgi:hypothetical protein
LSTMAVKFIGFKTWAVMCISQIAIAMLQASLPIQLKPV